MLSFLVDVAHAEGAAAADAAASPNPLFQFLPLVLIFVVFYFLMIRPQQKQAKERKAMLESVGRGDEVATSGGILGKVTAAADDILTIEIADNVRVRVQRGAVLSVIKKAD